ncbi:MAG: LysR family transcriptional regulator [Candidatus Hydrothermarchaeota archaeon]|nr:MAG: LysR family transcriptional regulator [Candidatus Hydrothermarchaeota archaeon]
MFLAENKIRLDYLETFKKVVETGSLLSVAKASNMSVSTVSVQIDSVESYFGIKLLERSASGVKPTKEGKMVYEVVCEVLRNLESARQMIQSLKTSHITFASGMVGAPIVAQIQTLFKVKYPKVTFTTEFAGALRCLEMVSEGKADVALVGYVPKGLDKEYIVKDIGTDELVLIGPPGCELFKREKIYLRDIIDCPMVVLNEEFGIRKSLDEALLKSNFNPADLLVAAEVDNIFSQIYSVSQGIGLAITSFIACKKVADLGIIEIRKIHDFKGKRTVYLVCKKRSLENENIRNFLNFVLYYKKTIFRNYDPSEIK